MTIYSVELEDLGLRCVRAAVTGSTCCARTEAPDTTPTMGCETPEKCNYPSCTCDRSNIPGR